MLNQKVADWLSAKGFKERITEHTETIDTVEHAAMRIGCSEAEIAKTLSFIVEEKPVIVVMAGDARVNSSKFKARFYTKPHMIPREQVEELTGFAPGGVCPFAIPEGIPVWLDISMKRFEYIHPAGGNEYVSVKLTPDELETASGAVGWCDVCKGWEELDQDINDGDVVMSPQHADIVKADDENDELFDVCDENGALTGKVVARSVAHRDGIAHRTVHVWITREYEGRRQILLQKRSRNKDSFPGMYDTSSAGHIQAGDEPLTSAVRELKEELGIAAEPSDLKFAGNFHAKYALEFHGSMFRDDEYVFVYVYNAPVDISDIVIQQEELECVTWFDLDEVYKDCKNGVRDRFCVPTAGLEVLIEYLKKCI